MRRVLIVDLSKNYGGADVRVAQIASGLDRRLDVRVAVLSGTQTSARLSASHRALVTFGRSRRDPRLFLDLKAAIRSFNPHVVDTHNPQSMLWGLAAAHAVGVRVRIATFHSVFEKSEMRAFGGPLNRALEFMVKRHATHIVSVSQPVTDHLLARRFPAQMITTIPNGVRLAELENKVTSARPKIVAVGRLVPVKGIDILLEALSILGQHTREFQCDIIGNGPERSRLEAMARALGLTENVNFLGYRSDSQSLISQSSVLVMPSISESMPFAALEAAAAGVPIVASNVGGLKTYFGDENAALMVQSRNPRELAAALLRCLTEPELRQALVSKARALISSRYSIEAMLEATERLYSGRGGAEGGGLALCPGTLSPNTFGDACG